mmetsp:Transcript_56021/g.132119  ORF Transcript_56021/g.132119 Transcript_56021/m.132119 type:complete len:256 (+) Transcript_56021:3-770(+)
MQRLFCGASVVATATVAQSLWNNNWDGHESQVPTKGQGSRHVIFVRHGQYVSADDDKDRILTPLGRQQAHLIGKRLTEVTKLTSENNSSVSLFCSTMTRAKETAAIINEELAKSRGSKLHITYLECIRECRPAVPDPLGSRSLATYQKDVQKCAPKMDEAFKTLLFRPPEDQTQDSVVIVVGHANVFRWLTLRVVPSIVTRLTSAQALQLEPEAWLRTSLANCSLTWLALRPSGHVTLKAFGDFGHLRPEETSFS